MAIFNSYVKLPEGTPLEFLSKENDDSSMVSESPFSRQTQKNAIFIEFCSVNLEVSLNRGIPKSILMEYSIVNHPFWGYPYLWKPPFHLQEKLEEVTLYYNNFNIRQVQGHVMT